MRIITDSNSIGIRIDVYLAALDELGLTRSRIQQLIKSENILLDGKPTKVKYLLKSNQTIDIDIPIPKDANITAENIPLDIIYEDDDICVVNKARGMVVHPAPGNWSGTLVNAIMYHCNNLSGINGEKRPGIVHRIDKDTTGLLVIAKNDTAHNSLAAQIQAKTAHRIYLALIHGSMNPLSGKIDMPIIRHKKNRKQMTIASANEGRHAVTNYTQLASTDKYSLVKLSLETGRTHQIRVHLNALKRHVVGDKLYGRKSENFNLVGQLLHAYKLEIIHPIKNIPMSFYAPLPDDFRNILNVLHIDYKEFLI